MKNFGIILDALTENEGMFFEDFDEEMVYEFYMEHGFMPINTYKAWDKLGYQVQKGEKKRMDLYLWVHKGKNQEIIDNDADGDSEKDKKKNPFYKKRSYMFDFSQVKPKEAEKLPDIPVYTGDIEVIDEIEEGTDLESVPENEVQDVVNDENNKMQFNYISVNKYNQPSKTTKEYLKSCRAALDKYVKNCLANGNTLSHEIQTDSVRNKYIVDGPSAIYMDFEKYKVNMPTATRIRKENLIPETDKKAEIKNIVPKALKELVTRYKKTTDNKNAFIKIDGVVFDTKKLLELSSIISSPSDIVSIMMPSDKKKPIIIVGQFGFALLCSMYSANENEIMGSIL